MSLQSQIFQKMTELEPNHKTQNLKKHPVGTDAKLAQI